MSSTPEYASDGTTLIEVIRRFEADGYTGQFAAVEGGRLRCFTCHQDSDADEVPLDELRRMEGASDPDDMAAVAAVECPHCGTLGTVALKYGPDASPEEQEVLQQLEDARHPPGSGL